MSFFNLPTESQPQDTGIGSVPVDEISSISTINANGGGTVSFEMTSPANSYFCPRMSYFNVRLNVTKSVSASPLTADEGGVTDYNTSVTNGCVQFKSYPAAQLMNSFSHQLNGVSVETTSNIPETAAILNRTSLSHEYLLSSGGSIMRLVGDDGRRNSFFPNPGGPLQPWDGVTKVFDCSFLPPRGFSLFRVQSRGGGIDLS